MKIRLILGTLGSDEYNYIVKKSVKIKKLRPTQIRISYFFKTLLKKLDLNPPLEFQNQTVRFTAFKIRYWTEINGQQKYYNIWFPFYGNLEKLPPLHKRVNDHILDILVHYQIL